MPFISITTRISMRRRMQSLAALMLLSASGTAPLVHAQTDAAAGLCAPDLTVDKDKLAARLLATYPVSTAYLSVGEHPAPLSSFRELASWLIKTRATEKSTGAVCKGDSCNADHIADDLQNLLDGKDAQFKPSSGAVAASFFEAGNQNKLICVQRDARLSLPHAASAASMTTAAPAPTAAAGAIAPTPAADPAATQQPGW